MGEDPPPVVIHPSSSQPNDSSTNTVSAPSGIAQYMSPYYLHHSDGTNLVLVSEPLTETNYTSWSRAMIDRFCGFVVKNKVGFVDGTIPCPSGDLTKWVLL